MPLMGGNYIFDGLVGLMLLLNLLYESACALIVTIRFYTVLALLVARGV